MSEVYTYTYSSAPYKVADSAAAKAIILTPQAGLSTDRRWETETPYLMGLIEEDYADEGGPSRLQVCDFGCGIGRLSRGLAHGWGCWCVGVDSSWAMRALAEDYVKDPSFLTCSPEAFDLLVAKGVQFDLGLAIWVLQHVEDPEMEIARLGRALRPRGGRLFVVNEQRRCVPTTEGAWIDDGIDIQLLLHNHAHIIEEGKLDPSIVSQGVSDRTFWGLYEFGP